MPNNFFCFESYLELTLYRSHSIVGSSCKKQSEEKTFLSRKVRDRVIFLLYRLKIEMSKETRGKRLYCSTAFNYVMKSILWFVASIDLTLDIKN